MYHLSLCKKHLSSSELTKFTTYAKIPNIIQYIIARLTELLSLRQK